MLLRIKAAAICLLASAVAALTSGCTVIPADISELETPPKLSADQQAIVKALEAHIGDKPNFKFPLEGDYRSAFIMKDLDHDGTTNVIAFYSASGSSASSPHIAVLDKVGDSWQATCDISSEGNEIDSIEFGDFNGDGHDDMAVGWRTFNSTDLTLIVYTRTGKAFTKTKLGTFTKMKTLDMDGNGKTDILLFKLDSDIKQAAARLISFRNGKLTAVSSSPLDSTVTSYSGVYITKLKGGDNAVLIDGVKSENKFITEIIGYKNGQLISPLYDNDKHTVNSTMRFVDYRCTDIDKDGYVEVPMPVELPYVRNKDDTNKVWLVRWNIFDSASNTWTPKLSCLMNYNEGYYFKYPKKWDSNVTVSRQDGDSTWVFCEWDAKNNKYGKTLFSINVYSESIWNTISVNEPIYKIAEKNGTVYAVKFDQHKSDSEYALTLDEISSNFRLLY